MQEEIINMQIPEVIEPDNSINYNCENCATIVTGYITRPVIGPLRGMKALMPIMAETKAIIAEAEGK